MPQIQNKHFNASEVLRPVVVPEGRAGVPFLNWHISARPLRERGAEPADFFGAGLYGICIDGMLAYVGSYLGAKTGIGRGQKVVSFAGDIVKGRWWQHFGSIAGRSHKLHVKPRTIDVLELEFGLNHPMVSALRANGPELQMDAGCLGALGRLRWAANHFDEILASAPEQILSRFCYVYARVTEMPNRATPISLAAAILAAERELAADLNLLINGAGQDPRRPSVVTPRHLAGDLLADTLRRHINLAAGHR
jgi:hypothetical protein